MAKTDIAKSGERAMARPRDIFSAMRDDMDRLFERFEQGWPRWPTGFGRAERMTMPELDVHESDDAVTVEAELPGVDEKDVTVTLANGVLTIKGEKKQEKEEKAESYHVTERSFGSFERSVLLPDTIDDSKIEATFDKGVLKVSAAKKPEAVRAARKIEISKG
ncbi:MAG: Hsp20/alpha crystallin family protein [Hyphomicrobiaceae bacterium]|nr:Hsp20/alpha crystallin family protein [Hyphomicrobiaceae bacterium]